MQQGIILSHTETIRVQLAKQFENDPKGELDCWVSTAHQREAMVVEVYKAVRLNSRIPDQSKDEAETVGIVRSVIGSIWAQEASHATLMGSLRKLAASGDVPLTGLQGTVEGLMTSWATSGGVLGKVAVLAVGAARAFTVAPSFTKELGSMPLGQFFRFSEELEQTASNGYRRILELLGELEESSQDSGYGALPQYEFATTLAEENFHRAMFQRMGAWLKSDELQLDAIPRESARDAIKELMQQHLGLNNVAGLPKGKKALTFAEADRDSLISDGGLGGLFTELELSPHVARRPEG